MPDVFKFFFAFVVVLAVIGIVAWVARRFMAGRLNTAAGRGRMPRLSVIDAAEFGDGRRKLVLVRRDNVEHLVMVGGPSDVVIETNIQRAAAAATRAPASDPSWFENEPTELREPAPMAEPPPPPPRPSRPVFAGDEPRRPPPPMPAPPERRPEPRHEPRPEPMAGFASETMRPPMRVAKPPMPRAPVTGAPPMPPVAPPAPAPASDAAAQADQNLAEMAQRLEAALRRPGAEPGPSVAVNPVDRIGAPPVAPDGPPVRKAAPPVEPPTAADQPPRKEETGFESLEAEMASLLGRPKNPT